MTLKRWEMKLLKASGAAARVAEIEEELRLAAGLTRDHTKKRGGTGRADEAG